MQYLLFAVGGNLLAVIFGFYWVKHLPLPYRLMLALVCVTLLCEILGHFSSAHHRGNAWVFNSFYLMPELWLTGLTGAMLTIQRLVKIAIPLALLAGSALWIFDITQYGVNVLSSASLLYVGICLTLIFLIVLVSTLYQQNLFKSAAFWLSVSVILYFSCNIPLFGMYNLISSRSHELLDKLYYINNILVAIRYPLVAFSFYLAGRQQLAEQRAT